MATERAPETVHAPLLLHFPRFVQECGADPAGLFQRAGLCPNAVEEGAYTYRQVAELLELTAAALGRPDFGMALASFQYRMGIVGPLGQAMQHAHSFGSVLELVVRHSYAHSLASHSWLRTSGNGESVMFGHDILLDDTPSTRQVMEQILLLGQLIAIRLTDGAVRPRRVLLRHRAVSPMPAYRRYFGCEVRFDQRVNATVYRKEDMSRRIVTADGPAFLLELAEIRERFAGTELPLARRVRGLILPVLDDEHCTVEWVANRLGIHLRTLHRRLTAEGTSFRLIKDEVRRDLARYYLLETDLEVRAISERLGFSEQSAFSRRARHWFGQAPTQQRRGLVQSVR